MDRSHARHGAAPQKNAFYPGDRRTDKDAVDSIPLTLFHQGALLRLLIGLLVLLG